MPSMSFRSTETFLVDIARSIVNIQAFVTGLTLQDYRGNLLIRSAVERQMQILTEAAFRLGDQAEKLCPGIDWRNIRGLGNFLRHEYDFVSDDIMWVAIARDLPPLKLAAERAILDIGQESDSPES